MDGLKVFSGSSRPALAQELWLDLPIAIIDKRRSGDDERAQAVAVIGDVVGKRCLLVDDELATGGTIFSATDFLLEHGARSVSAAVVHPVLSGRAVERLGGLAPAAPPRHQYDPSRHRLVEGRGPVRGSAARRSHHPHPRRALRFSALFSADPTARPRV